MAKEGHAARRLIVLHRHHWHWLTSHDHEVAGVDMESLKLTLQRSMLFQLMEAYTSSLIQIQISTMGIRDMEPYATFYVDMNIDVLLSSFPTVLPIV